LIIRYFYGSLFGNSQLFISPNDLEVGNADWVRQFGSFEANGAIHLSFGAFLQKLEIRPTMNLTYFSNLRLVLEKYRG